MQPRPPISRSGARRADGFQIIHASRDAGQAFVVLRAGHPTVRQRVRGRLQLVDRQILEQRPPRPQDADVRAEHLVRRKREKIAVPRLYVDRPVRREVHGIDEHQSAGIVSPAANRRHVVDGADRVGGDADRHEARARTELPPQTVQIERAVFGMDVDPAHRSARVLGRQHPGADVRIVIEPRHHDLVAGLQRLGERPAKLKGQRRHVGAEDDLVRRRRVDEIRDRFVRAMDDRVRLAAGGEDAAVVAVARC